MRIGTEDQNACGDPEASHACGGGGTHSWVGIICESRQIGGSSDVSDLGHRLGRRPANRRRRWGEEADERRDGTKVVQPAELAGRLDLAGGIVQRVDEHLQISLG
jgi:hypothetical protein